VLRFREMKKAIFILVIGLFWCSVGFAEIIKLSCNPKPFGSGGDPNWIYEYFDATIDSVNKSFTIKNKGYYKKKGNQNFVSLEQRGVAAINAVFNLDLGTVTSGSGTITSAGDGWYRCSVQETTSDTSDLFIIGRGNSGSVGDTFYIWGAQLETAAAATTYLPTTSSALVGLTGVTRGANGTTAQSASSSDSIQQLPYALSEVNMPTRLKGLSVASDGTGAGRLTLCDKVGTTLCDVDLPDNRLYELSWDGGIIFPNGIYVANSDNLTAYTLFTDKHSGAGLS